MSGMREYLMASPCGKKRWYEEHPHETERREPNATGEHTTATKQTNHKPKGTKRARYGEGAQARTRRRKRHEDRRTKDGLRERRTQRRHASAAADRENAMKTTLLPLSMGHQRGRKPPTPKKMWTPPKNTRRPRGRQHRGTEDDWYEGIPNGQPMRKEEMA